MLDEIVAIYAIVEDLLKAIGHQEDCRIQMSDAEVITAALVAARLLGARANRRQTAFRSHPLFRWQPIFSLSIFTRTWINAEDVESVSIFSPMASSVFTITGLV